VIGTNILTVGRFTMISPGKRPRGILVNKGHSRPTITSMIPAMIIIFCMIKIENSFVTGYLFYPCNREDKDQHQKTGNLFYFQSGSLCMKAVFLLFCHLVKRYRFTALAVGIAPRTSATHLISLFKFLIKCFENVCNSQTDDQGYNQIIHLYLSNSPVPGQFEILVLPISMPTGC